VAAVGWGVLLIEGVPGGGVVRWKPGVAVDFGLGLMRRG
jgi:hypothetical protein